MILLSRPVKFEDVDAAAIVFFGRYLTCAHEAMENFFGALPGGYADVILRRRMGFPAVNVEMNFSSPARYGDTLHIETRVVHLGNRSATFAYRMLQAGSATLCCEVRHKVVTTSLETLKSIEMPADVRQLLSQHLEC